MLEYPAYETAFDWDRLFHYVAVNLRSHRGHEVQHCHAMLGDGGLSRAAQHQADTLVPHLEAQAVADNSGSISKYAAPERCTA